MATQVVFLDLSLANRLVRACLSKQHRIRLSEILITPESRPSADSAPSVSNQSRDLQFMVKQLSDARIKSLLSELARTTPAVGSAVTRAYESIDRAAQIGDNETPKAANPNTTPATAHIDFDY